MEIVEEKIKMLMEQEEFAFIKDIPHEQLWKLAFALNFIQESDWIPVKYRDMTQEEIERYSEYTEATKMFDCKMPDDGRVGLFLVLGLHDDELLHVEVAVVGPGDHGGTIVAGILADQNGGAGHGCSPFSS